jgi:hypothetical protein
MFSGSIDSFFITSSVTVGIVFLCPSLVTAEITPSQEQTTNPIAQLTSISNLSDVQTSDWEFQALQSLIERYSCGSRYLEGYNRDKLALTRDEFAAGLNTCLSRIKERIQSGTTNLATQKDLELLKQLQSEFAPELAELRGRVDILAAQTTQLDRISTIFHYDPIINPAIIVTTSIQRE